METIAIVISLAGVIAYLEYRLRPLLVASEMSLRGIWKAPVTFKCHFCHKSFPVGAREDIGEYSYCPDHGSKRQATLVAPARLKKFQLPPSSSNGETPETLPWED